MTAPSQQKLKVKGPVVVTANRVVDGAVVYWTADREWSTDLANAAVVSTAPEAEALLAGARADGLHAVDCYVAPVARDQAGRTQPGNLRERIRFAGPTIDRLVTFGI
jgi:hypothetical protein